MSISEIQVFDNGPLLVRGENICLKDAAGNEFPLEGKTSVALCRCGKAASKPFCDGSHKEGFDSAVKAG